MTGYNRRPVRAPRISGAALRAFAAAVESPLVGPALLARIGRDNGIERFRRAPAGSAPLAPVALRGSEPAPAPVAPAELVRQALSAPAPAGGTPLESVAAYERAYRSGAADPVSVVARLHAAVERLDAGPERLAIFIARKPEQVLAAAARSAERWRANAPLSPLDGVPIVVKDEADVSGFPTTLGTSFLDTPAERDASAVARLVAAGALVLGKANMNEIGISPLGMNVHHGVCRNPYAPTHVAGGSSGGSAAAVAAGLAPLALGLDGGGSIRVPAALCGVVGLKPTLGRVSLAGVPPLCWTMGHLGPIGLTVADVAAGYAIVAGADARDPATREQPAVHLAGFAQTSLSGLRVGVCRAFFEDAEPDVVARCDDALRALVHAGARVEELPPPDLDVLLWAHTVIILSEMAAAMWPHTERDPGRFGGETRINLALGRSFGAVDRVHAMRHRHRITLEQLALLERVDVIATPTCAMTAPAIAPSSLPSGESNLEVVDALMRFIRVANVTGLPALSVPAGYDRRGLPVGLQLMGRAYEEALLLRVARVVEAAVPRREPAQRARALES